MASRTKRTTKKPRRESKDRRALRSLLMTYEFRLKDAQRDWDNMVELIRTNPNQMNPRGIWQGEQLHNLQSLRYAICIFDGIVRDLQDAVKDCSP
jgi:hypothetical protein